MNTNSNIKGFTLIELLVALMVFSTLSILAYGGLDAVLKADERLRFHSSNLKQLTRTWMMVGQDLNQLVGRSIRDNYGTAQPALIANEMGNYLLEFTRGGWPNPRGMQRSNLQRVGFGLANDRLVRYNWSVIDRAPDSEPREYVLIENVNRLEFRFLDAQMEWHQNWPPLSRMDDDPEILPVAIEVLLEIEKDLKFRRLFRTTDYVW
ncbi:MAG: type II secretion system minor pseudopilin GspJ [Gammaproteobacteria bacterium]|nr:type II secretion system minor pseudopilin GspJ [Gammaproteobacteria bacterium]